MHNRRSSGVQGLVFGGIMAALVVLFSLVPFLSLFTAVPLVLTYIRYGGRAAGLTTVVAAIFSAMFLGPIQALLFVVPAGIVPGLVFGYGFRHKLKPLMIGVMAVGAFILTFGLQYVVMRSLVTPGRDPLMELMGVEMLKPVYAQLADTFEQVAATQQQPAVVQQYQSLARAFRDFEQNTEAIVWALLPSLLLMMGALAAWVNYSICRWIVPRFGHEIPAPTSFREFRLPVWLTWVFTLVSLGAGFVATRFGGGTDASSLAAAPWQLRVFLNLLQPLQILFMLAGLSVAYGYLRKKEVSKGFAIAISLMGVFLLGGLGLQLYIMLAMWDSIFDFRGLGHGMLKRHPGENS